MHMSRHCAQALTIAFVMAVAICVTSAQALPIAFHVCAYSISVSLNTVTVCMASQGHAQYGMA